MEWIPEIWGPVRPDWGAQARLGKAVLNIGKAAAAPKRLEWTAN